jgi:basic membrane protein A
MKDVAGAVYNLAKSVHDGKPETGVVRASLSTGGVSLADSNPVFKNNADLQAALKKAEAGIKDGSITVKTS